jgi:deoxycytidylate deaminase
VTKRLQRKLSKIDILVWRQTSEGGEIILKQSKPCHDCIVILKKLGIKGVYYTDSNGNILYEKISNINNMHKSQLSRSSLIKIYS